MTGASLAEGRYAATLGMILKKVADLWDKIALQTKVTEIMSDRAWSNHGLGCLSGAAIAGKELSRMRADPGEERCAASF